MRSNFICIRFIGIVFDAVWLQRLCFFLSDFFEFGRFQKIFSFSKKIIIKTNLLCCPAPFLQYRFFGSAFLPRLRFFGFVFCRFFLFTLPLFCFSNSVYLAFFLSFSSAMFLLPRFSCSVFQSAKSLKKCSKNFMVWRSLYRGHILTIFILILSNLIQKIKTQFVFFLDFCCF